MTRRRLALIVGGIALTAGATVGTTAAQADVAPPVSVRSGYVACAGVDTVNVAVCVENPATIIDGLPRAREVVQGVTGG